MINIDLSDARAHENGFNVGLDETQITEDIHNIKISPLKYIKSKNQQIINIIIIIKGIFM